MRQKIDRSVRRRMRDLGLGLAAALVLAAWPVSAQDTNELVIASSQFAKEGWEPWISASGETSVVNAIGDTLLKPDPETGLMVGNLAESFSLSDDLTTWTFKLRPDIPFHDGWGTVTAEDVKFSWEQFVREDSTVNLAGVYRQAIDGDMDNFVIKGPLEFELHTTKPVIFLPSAVSSAANSSMKVQSKAYWDADPERARLHPIGTGPYRFVSYDPGVEVALEAVENHWRQTPTFKRLTFKIIDDEAARLNQVASGEVDIAPLNPRLLGEAMNMGLQIFGVPEAGNVNFILGGWYPGIGDPALGESEEVRNHPMGAERYNRDAPWIQADNPEKGLAIRQALSLAIDREAILEVVMAGRGELLTAPFVQFPSNPALTDPAWTVPPYDPERAKALLAEGGYPDGFEITIPVFEWQDRAFTVDISEAVAGMWEAIGIKVNRLRVDYQFYRDIAGTRTSAGMAYPIIAAYYVEAAQGLSATFMPTSGSARLYDPSIIAAVNAMNQEPDQQKRFKITHDLLGHLREQVIGIPLFTYEAPFVATSKIASWEPTIGDATLSNFESMTAATQ